MRKIDMQNWSRWEHFDFFNEFNHPHFSICANVELTRLYPFVKGHGYSLNAAIIYVVSRAANAVPEFCYRIKDGEVVEHETVSPAVTILMANDLFSFCTIDYSPNFTEFAARYDRQIAAVKENPTLQDPPGREDLLFMTALPWISFTSFSHPMRLHPADSVPRFAWGKFFPEGERLMMPLSVQGHHALMDGIHMGKYYGVVEDILGRPEEVLGGG